MTDIKCQEEAAAEWAGAEVPGVEPGPEGAGKQARDWGAWAVRTLPGPGGTAFVPNAGRASLTNGEYPVLRGHAPSAGQRWPGNEISGKDRMV